MNDTAPFDSSFTVDPTGNDPFAAAKASAMKAAEDLKAAAAAKANEIRHAAEQRTQQLREAAEQKGAQIRDYADKTWQGARTDINNLTEQAEKFAREKPLQALLTAFGVGFIVGTILRR